MRPESTRVLDAAAVAAVVTHVGLPGLFDLAVDRVHRVLAEHATGRVDLRERDGFATGPGLVEWMPAVRHGSSCVVKIVGYHPDNPVRRLLPTILSAILIVDAETGHLCTVLDGTFATAVRTGAASAVASRLLAAPGSAVLGLVGCGVQAVTQLHALSRVLDIEDVLVHDVDPVAAAGFAARARLPEDIVRVTPVAEIERHADVLCTATSVAPGAGPVLPGDELPAHAHVNAIGSDYAGKHELPVGLLRRAVVCPDDIAQAVREGECQQLNPDELGPSLTELVARPERAEPLRERTTVFDSTGLALQDLAMAELLGELAAELGLGREIELEAGGADPRDPYGFVAGAADLSWPLAARAGA